MRGRPERRKPFSARALLAQAAMVIAAAAMLAPTVWMVSTSLKPESEVLSATPRWLPSPPTLENYTTLFSQAEDFPVVRWFANSVFVSSSVTLLVLLVASSAAYAFARLQFTGREPLFMMVVATMIIPSQITLIPVFMIVQKLGWFNTYFGLIVPGLAGGFGVFLLRQFFLSIPLELEEAAYMDGAGPLTVYLRVILPLGKPALATLAIFTFIGSWNDFAWPLIVTNDISMRTLPIGIMIFQGRYTTEYGLTMAAAAVCTIPIIIAFLLLQRRITEGIALTGLKQ